MGLALLATANAILKEDYLGPLRTQLNTATPVLSRLDKNTRDIVGLEAWIPVEMALSQAAGARGENEVLPTASKGEYQELKAKLKHYYGALQVSGPVMRQTSKGERGSFGRIIDIEAKGMRRLLSLVIAHDFYKGHTLGVCTAEGAVNTFTLATGTNMEYFFKNMVVSAVNSSSGAVTDSLLARTITAVDRGALTITVDGAAATVAITDEWIRAGTFGNTVTSLDEIIDDTADIYGVTTSDFEEWKSTVTTGVGAFSISALQTHLDKIMVRSGKMPTAIYSDYTLQRKYFELLTLNPRYVETSPQKVLDGGFKTLAYTGGGAPMPWIADRLAPGETIYTIHEPDIKLFTPGDFDFIDIGGDVWLPDILGSSPKDNFKAVLFRDMELGAFARNSSGKMEGVT